MARGKKPAGTLLEKIQGMPVAQMPQKSDWRDPERVEVALYWLQGRCTLKQIALGLDKKIKNSQNIKVGLLTALQQAYAEGKLKIQ